MHVNIDVTACVSEESHCCLLCQRLVSIYLNYDNDHCQCFYLYKWFRSLQTVLTVAFFKLTKNVVLYWLTRSFIRLHSIIYIETQTQQSNNASMFNVSRLYLCRLLSGGEMIRCNLKNIIENDIRASTVISSYCLFLEGRCRILKQ